MEEEQLIKRRKTNRPTNTGKRSTKPTHLHCKQKTFWLDKDLNAYLKEITDEIGISQNYFINAILRKFKSGELVWKRVLTDEIVIASPSSEDIV